MLSRLVLNIAPELEEDLVDYLMSLDCVSGFTALPVVGNGGMHNMNTAEQVSGRRRRLQFDLILEAADVDQILSGLREEVGRDILYWEQPVTRFGKV